MGSHRDDEKVQVMHEFFHTQREIRKIERGVLAKRGEHVPGGPFCSFCGWSKEELPVLIHGAENAYVCSNCAHLIAGLAKPPNDPQA